MRNPITILPAVADAIAASVTSNNTEVSETISCCKSIIPGTRHLFPNDAPTTKNTNYVNVVQNENIKISSDYASQISTLNNDRGWVISQ